MTATDVGTLYLEKKRKTSNRIFFTHTTHGELTSTSHQRVLTVLCLCLSLSLSLVLEAILEEPPSRGHQNRNSWGSSSLLLLLAVLLMFPLLPLPTGNSSSSNNNQQKRNHQRIANGFLWKLKEKQQRLVCIFWCQGLLIKQDRTNNWCSETEGGKTRRRETEEGRNNRKEYRHSQSPSTAPPTLRFDDGSKCANARRIKVSNNYIQKQKQKQNGRFFYKKKKKKSLQQYKDYDNGREAETRSWSSIIATIIIHDGGCDVGMPGLLRLGTTTIIIMSCIEINTHCYDIFFFVVVVRPFVVVRHSGRTQSEKAYAITAVFVSRWYQ